ncbi:MAG: radical SAM protein [Candidatus Cloacimonetes bacterium]|nr:radical SAM protein [Candidatus Cloacimonadota bacterium]
MNVLLVSPKARTGGLESLRPGNQILQGVLYVAAAAQRAGHDVIVVVADSTDIQQHIEHYKPQVLGVSCVTATYHIARDIIRMVKASHPSLKTIIGGHHATFLYKEVFEESGVDYVCRGEGEEVFPALLTALTTGDPYPCLPGIVFKKDGHYYNDEQIALLESLDDLPRISRDLVAPGLTFAPKIVTSRGCPFHCSFCSISAFYQGRYRQRTVEAVISDIEDYVSWGYRQFWFHDDNLTINTAWVEEFCKQLIKRRIRIDWNCMSRVDTICNSPRLMGLMAAAGCKLLAIGIESGIPEVLEGMHKKINENQIIQAIKILNNIKISHNWYMIIGSGDKYDTPKYIEQNISFFRKFPFGFVLISVLTPFPGTELYRKIESENRLLHKNWEFYDATHCVYQPLGMSASKLEKYLPLAYRKIYLGKGLKLIPLLLNSFTSHALKPRMILRGATALFKSQVLGKSFDESLKKK